MLLNQECYQGEEEYIKIATEVNFDVLNADGEPEIDGKEDALYEAVLKHLGLASCEMEFSTDVDLGKCYETIMVVFKGLDGNFYAADRLRSYHWEDYESTEDLQRVKPYKTTLYEYVY